MGVIKLPKIDDAKSDSYYSTFQIFKSISNTILGVRKFVLPHCCLTSQSLDFVAVGDHDDIKEVDSPKLRHLLRFSFLYWCWNRIYFTIFCLQSG